MCNLTTPLDKESVIGYKVVAMKDGKHYSPSTGICYEDYEEMPETIIPEPAVEMLIASDISPNGPFYSTEMIGRTAIFTKEEDALDLQQILIDLEVRPTYNVEVVRAEVHTDLLKGTVHLQWTQYANVVAGRKIKFLEE